MNPLTIDSPPVFDIQDRPLTTGSRQRRKSKPTWNRTLRTLQIAGEVVKQFTWPAANQELILTAFQEEDWPASIDDPLPLSPQVCPKRRLHDTIKCLNRKRIVPLIRFYGDGTGEGVGWEYLNDVNANT